MADLKKVVLVTGAAGFIGYHLVRRLLDMGVRVIGFDNINSYYDVNLKKSRLKILRQYEKISFVKGDLINKKEIDAVFINYNPQVVVNLAA